MSKILGEKFFQGKTLKIAQELIGANLCRRIDKKVIKLPIAELEAYDGFSDKASHASRGKTPRNFPMFESGGIWYVYFVYGNHWMLNIVTGTKDYPGAILIRGAGEIIGPGRLTKFLKIDKNFNSKPANKKTGLWIEKNNQIKNLKIKKTPRIGVDYAGPIWSKKLYRFVLEKGKMKRKCRRFPM